MLDVKDIRKYVGKFGVNFSNWNFDIFAVWALTQNSEWSQLFPYHILGTTAYNFDDCQFFGVIEPCFSAQHAQVSHTYASLVQHPA